MKVGFVGNCWATPKGHSYMVRDMVTALQDTGVEVHMYRIGEHNLVGGFPQLASLENNSGNIIPEDLFRQWLDRVNPEWCVFMEYNQWWKEDHNKVKICKELGIKTAGFLVYERLNWNDKDDYCLYDKIICPTGYQTKLMRKHGIYNTIHVPWGTDINEIDSVMYPERVDDKIIFYHCAGSGGVDNRKNTDAVVSAYKQIQDENTDLKITHLSIKAFERNEIISFIKMADVVVNTAKWDSIGLVSLEANACSRPVVVVDMPPVNELVKDKFNGMLVPGEIVSSKKVTCPAYNVNVEDLAKTMMLFKNKIVLDVMKRNARKFAEINFDWAKNKKYFSEVFT